MKLLTQKELAENIGCSEEQVEMACFPMRNGKYSLEDVEGHFAQPEFYEWTRMLSRCEDPMDPDYPEFGGRGIQVCERWHFFDKFMEDVGPMPGVSIQ